MAKFIFHEYHVTSNNTKKGYQKFNPSIIDRVKNLKFATYLKFATCENTNKDNELR